MKTKKNYIYALSAVMIWATMAAVVKVVLFDIPNLEALSVSSLFAFFFLLIMNIGSGQIKDCKSYSVKEYGVMSGLGFSGMFVYSALYYYGLSQLTSQVACIVNYLWPMMLLVFSCIIGSDLCGDVGHCDRKLGAHHRSAVDWNLMAWDHDGCGGLSALGIGFYCWWNHAGRSEM